ncbi:bifunctional phosphopantothenoylcysteine decarboxylase/phosphopantothenate--cysteine ligase CoaBC [Derxia lacustris]|uniref:bifunctional phosphopantothenoylcysteine decarboxylase/phosphopantothenate--cysteine ligase CoaBC n=1 Tax=Derxia lacustris TaxID=764842 RepID=UPI000A17541F|nr:bifunctional phosphopantothenoylcysteine decarboxylase/phosphopantothenate--cysteine ligase CoaBC [Derxia lacustris]
MQLQGKHIVLGLTGGIACYKAAELCRALGKEGATVQVAMTESATRFITPLTLQALSGRPVALSQWASGEPNAMPHINLTRGADAIVIAPCSADFIAKLAHGLADDLLATLCIGRPAQVRLLVAPAMNVEMWQQAPVQRNVAQLRADGIAVLGPAEGEQACGEVGAGRMLEPAEIVDAVVASFQPQLLAGRRLLITAGPTYEPIDAVRGITNLSSGKMGYAIARAAREAGADVTLVSGPTALAAPSGVARIDVRSAAQMLDAVMARLDDTDVFIGVAAVADWRVASAVKGKLKKEHGLPKLDLESNPDILATVAERAQAAGHKPYCVGFAAESDNLDAHAEAKRLRKGVPLLAGNLGPQTFGQDDNELALYDDRGITRLPRADKLTLARHLVAAIAQRLP